MAEQRALEKAGFTREGVLRHACFRGGEWQDMVVFSKLRGEGVSSTGPGFACLLGRPNTGKSTLTNALVGTKVAIMSDRPQTTRHAIRGIVHRPDAQLVLVDTPGFHRPRTLLGERLNELVLATLAEVDVVILCVPADQKVGPGDRFIAAQLAKVAATPRSSRVVTKTDTRRAASSRRAAARGG